MMNCSCGAPPAMLRPIFGDGETDFRLCNRRNLAFRERLPIDAEFEDICLITGRPFFKRLVAPR
jgi:hypothetical protein